MYANQHTHANVKIVHSDSSIIIFSCVVFFYVASETSDYQTALEYLHCTPLGSLATLVQQLHHVVLVIVPHPY